MRALVILLLGIGLSFAACGDSDPDPTTSPTTSSPSGASGADLAVTFVRVYPGTPTAGTAFNVRAQVGNLGDAPSGKYDVSAVVWDVSRDVRYPAGAATMDVMYPGEDYSVIDSDISVLDPGSYQLQVEVSPWGSDANSQNDYSAWAFTVS